jgi:glycosyltransferase involved in cell wall biosynthesis
MRILLWHGYLLSGSGSNLFTANVANVWRRAGHDVLLMCQERHPERFAFIDAHGDFDRANTRFQLKQAATLSDPGRCTVVRPHIGAVLPVYVFDEYEGFTAKLFVDLSDDELDRYTSSNVEAMTVAIEGHQPEAVITGHEVMGPFVAKIACARAGISYVAKLHGSALEYAVKKQSRYVAYAREGLCGASAVTGGSRYMLEEAASLVPGWRDRAVVVNPGCDVELFRPRRRSPGAPPTVGYVGKLIPAKGPQHLPAALPLTSIRGLRAGVVGYGGAEREIRDLWEALARGSPTDASAAAQTLPEVSSWLHSERVDDAYFRRAAEIPLLFTGRLEHEPLARLLPDFDVLVVSSVVPEAFGMVAAEAAACGVLPIVPSHSGIGEVGDTLEQALGADGLLTFDPKAPISGIATALERVLSIPVSERRAMGDIVAGVARELWTWEQVARRLLAVATGELRG